DGFAPTEDSFSFATRKRRRFYQAWSAAVDEVIAARRQCPPTAGRRDMLDLLFVARDPDSGGTLSDLEIRDQCGTLIVPGDEPTPRLLFGPAYLLPLDQDEGGRLRWGVRPYPPARVAKLDALNNWPLLRQTLLEPLRLYPPVAHIARGALVDDIAAGEP